MNNNAKKWVDELRSGQYRQGKDALRVAPTLGEWYRGRDTHCCLGVACDLYARETGDGEWVYDDVTREFTFEMPDGGDSESGWLPRGVMRWLGLADASGGYHDNTSLSDLNDGGASFAVIAAVIESEPEGLFA